MAGKFPVQIHLSWSFLFGGDDEFQADVSYVTTYTLNADTVVITGSGTHPGNVVMGHTYGFGALAGTAITSYEIELSVTSVGVGALGGLFLETRNLPAAIGAAAPEPDTFALLGSTLAGLAGLAWRRRKFAHQVRA